MASEEPVASRMVQPSDAARATALAAMPPPAPARFSMTTGCLRSSSIFLVRMRAITSLGPPGAKPSTNVIGLAGNSAAEARGIAQINAANPAVDTFHRFIAFLPADSFLSQRARDPHKRSHGKTHRSANCGG